MVKWINVDFPFVLTNLKDEVKLLSIVIYYKIGITPLNSHFNSEFPAPCLMS